MKTLASRLVAQCQTHWDRTAISDSSGARFTYGEVLQKAASIAAWIRRRTANPSIGISLPASTTAALINYGVTLAGRTAVNLNFASGEANVRAAVDVCGLDTVIDAALAQRIFAELAPAEVDCGAGPDDLACIVFSSGSTGVPKGAELSHAAIVENADALVDFIPLAADDCMLGALPFFHSFGYTFALWFPVLEGIRAAYHYNPTDARVIGDMAEAESATFMLSTPTLCLQYARRIEAEKFRSLRYVLVGAEKLRESVAREFREHFGFELLAGYGCTELGPGVAINRPGVMRAGSVGKPLRDVKIRIADPETEEELPAGKQGMIWVAGPSRMRAYHRNPEATAAVLRGDFYVTGDLGYVDEDGFVYVTDRLARFSKVAGEMVPHLKIEESVAGVAQTFVTGVPDRKRGERLLMLFIGETTAQALHKRLVESELPALWIPKRDNIYRVDAIPLLANGKVDLRRAREMAAELAGA